MCRGDSNNVGRGFNTNFPHYLLILILSFWLCVSTARQAFDLVGRLWVPVVFNIFQVLSCILGLFAAFQNHALLLAALSASTVISIAYNMFLLLWYEDVFGGDWRDSSDALSAGEPLAHSFFLRYTPFCDDAAYLNISTSRWHQDADRCYVSYYRVESVQAGVHVVFAAVTLAFSVTMLLARRRSANVAEWLKYGVEPDSPDLVYGSARKPVGDADADASKTPRRGRHNGLAIYGASVASSSAVHNEFADYTTMKSLHRPTIKLAANCVKAAPHDFIDEFSGGFSNASYDGASAADAPEFNQQKSLLERLSEQRECQRAQNNSSTASYGWMFRQADEKSDSPNSMRSANIGRRSQLWRPSDYSAATTVELDGRRPSSSMAFHRHAASISTSSSTGGEDSVPLPPRRSPPQPNFLRTFSDASQQKNDNNNNVDDRDSATYSEIGVYSKEAIDSAAANYERPLSRVGGTAQAVSIGVAAGGRLFASRNAGGASGRYAKMRKTASMHTGNEHGGRDQLPPLPLTSTRQRASVFSESLLNRCASQNQVLDNRQPAPELQSFAHSRSATNTPDPLSQKSQMYSGMDTFYEFNNGNFQRTAHRGSATNLISFDPKSNTLIRVRKHHPDPATTDDNTAAVGIDAMYVEAQPPYFSHRRSNSQPMTHEYCQQAASNRQPPDHEYQHSDQIHQRATPGQYNVNEFVTIGNVVKTIQMSSTYTKPISQTNCFIDVFPQLESGIPLSNGCNRVVDTTSVSNEKEVPYFQQACKNDNDNYNHPETVYSIYSNEYCIDVDRSQPSTYFSTNGPIHATQEAQITVASCIKLVEENINDNKHEEVQHTGLTPSSVKHEANSHLNSYIYDDNNQVTSFPKENGRVVSGNDYVTSFSADSSRLIVYSDPPWRNEKPLPILPIQTSVENGPQPLTTFSSLDKNVQKYV